MLHSSCCVMWVLRPLHYVSIGLSTFVGDLYSLKYVEILSMSFNYIYDCIERLLTSIRLSRSIGELYSMKYALAPPSKK